MTLRERIARLKQRRQPAQPPEDLQRLRERLEHLEALVEGLQDAVHRDSIRHEERMTELERRIQPEVLAKALSADARRRGL
jgi:alkylation response protein AidB-like acyl-CoA dehydrogenase